MTFAAKVIGSLERDMRREAAALRRVADAAVRKATFALRDKLRGQMARAFKGRRIQNAWRAKFWPARAGKNPLGVVRTNAWHILKSFETGEPIRARSGKYLAIPTGFNRDLGRRGAKSRMTAKQMAAQPRGMTYVHRSGSGALLWWLRVAKASRVKLGTLDGRAHYSRSRITDVFVNDRRLANVKRRKLAAAVGAVPMFVLVKEVRRGKRLQVERAAMNALNDLQAALDRGVGGWADGR